MILAAYSLVLARIIIIGISGIAMYTSSKTPMVPLLQSIP